MHFKFSYAWRFFFKKVESNFNIQCERENCCNIAKIVRRSDGTRLFLSNLWEMTTSQRNAVGWGRRKPMTRFFTFSTDNFYMSIRYSFLSDELFRMLILYNLYIFENVFETAQGWNSVVLTTLSYRYNQNTFSRVVLSTYCT